MSRISLQKSECSIGDSLHWDGKSTVTDPEVWRRPMNHNSVARPAL